MSSYGWSIKDVSQRLYDQLQPLSGADARLGWPMLAYIDAIGLMFQDAADLVEDGPNGEPGWSIVLDINRIPDAGLPWLAQFIGLSFFQGLTPNQQRQQIRDHANWARGTPASIIAAVRLFLTGTQSVTLAERDTSAYHFTVTIATAEAPASTAALIAYVNQFAKPAGLQWTLVVGSATASTYLTIYNRGDLYSDIYNNFTTYNDIR